MSDLKTDLDILDFISKQTEHKAGSVEIKAFSCESIPFFFLLCRI